MKNIQEKLISVIITCYNNELYIEECIKNVLNNKSSNIEIILINDGSTDNSLNVINKYAKDIKIITITNKGLSNARNRGLEEAIGKYILFIDGDDYISSSSLKNIEEYISNNEFDLLLLNTTKYYEDKKIFEKEILSFKNDILTTKDLIDYKICGRAWRFLYKKEIIDNNNLRFHSTVIYEDEEWVPIIIYYSKIIKYLDIDYYYYRKRKNSITTTKSFENIYNLVSIIQTTYNWNKDKEWDNKYIYFSLSRCIRNLLNSTNYLSNEDSVIIINWYNENKDMIFDILKYNKKLALSLKLFGPKKGIKTYKKIFKDKNKTKKQIIV